MRLALKRLLPHLAEVPAARERFAREVELLGRIASPHLPELREADLAASAPWCVTTYRGGLDLGRLTAPRLDAGHPLPAASVAAIGLGVARGLTALHTARGAAGQPLGIVHRDVSPRNVILSPLGHVELIDLGNAWSGALAPLTESGVVQGTRAYLSPEQIQRGPVSAATDLFALGTILWELAAGRRLFLADSPHATFERILALPAPALPAGLPASLSAIIARCLAKRPSDRPPSAAAVAEALAPTAGPLSDGASSALAALYAELERPLALPQPPSPRADTQ